MPHVLAEYSANLEPAVSPVKLLAALHAAAAASGIADLSAVRSRAIRRDVTLVGDGNGLNGFVHVLVRLKRGRTPEVRRALGESLLAAAGGCLADAFAAHPLTLTVEVQEIEPEMLFRKSNLPG